MSTTKTKQIILAATAVMAMFILSCAKKPTGVRSVKQTTHNVVNPQVTNPSVQAAGAQNIHYQLTSIELPGEPVNGTISVRSEILTPSGYYIPITTTHTAAQMDAYGVVNDNDNGVKLDIRTRCIGQNCEKYIMLITVVKNNHSVHQMIAISNYNQSFFNLEQINASVPGGSQLFYGNIDQVLQRNSTL